MLFPASKWPLGEAQDGPFPLPSGVAPRRCHWGLAPRTSRKPNAGQREPNMRQRLPRHSETRQSPPNSDLFWHESGLFAGPELAQSGRRFGFKAFPRSTPALSRLGVPPQIPLGISSQEASKAHLHPRHSETPNSQLILAFFQHERGLLERPKMAPLGCATPDPTGD